MRAYFLKTLSLLTLVVLMQSCSVETDSYQIETPVLVLNATGPLFEGSNTATATWEFTLEELFPDVEGDIIVHKAKVSSINIQPKGEEDFPKVDKMVMEIKSKYINMTRIGLLESNIQVGKEYSLSVADKQEEIATALQDERITFVADFDMIDEEYYEDLSFDLVVSFEVEVRK